MKISDELHFNDDEEDPKEVSERLNSLPPTIAWVAGVEVAIFLRMVINDDDSFHIELHPFVPYGQKIPKGFAKRLDSRMLDLLDQLNAGTGFRGNFHVHEG